MLMMETLKRVAPRYGLQALLHEKPFAGVNGSGKHNNWSMSTDTGVNLLDPQDDTHTNMQFLVFLVATIRAVDIHADLLRASIASAANDHRLGANEAPPAIISIFLGKMLNDILEQVERGLPKRTIRGGTLDLGAKHAPAASAALGRPEPHVAVRLHREQVRISRRGVERQHRLAQHRAQYHRRGVTRLRGHGAGAHGRGKAVAARLQAGVPEVLKKMIKQHKRVIFDGDNYSEEWHKEAERRGLPNLRDSVAAFHVLRVKKNAEIFRKYGVLNQAGVRITDPHPAREVRQAAHDRGGDDGVDRQKSDPAGRAGASASRGRIGGGHQGGGRGRGGLGDGAA